MTWEAVGAIGEVVAALGVIATLVYLSVQIRQNTRALRAGSYQSWGDQINRINHLTIDNPEYAPIWTRALTDPASLTDEEYHRVYAHLMSAMHAFEYLYQGYCEGAVPEALWQAEESSLRHLIALPLVAYWWDSNPLGLTDAFRARVDALRAEGVTPGAFQDALKAPGKRLAEPASS